MNKPHLGSCLCGTARFGFEGPIDRFYLCHCLHCRKGSGSAHGANLFSSTGRLTWLSGQDSVRVYHLPGTRHTKAFCTLCGSALPHATGGMVVVPAGSLDTALTHRPDAHLFFAGKAEWDHDLGDLPAFDALPPGA